MDEDSEDKNVTENVTEENQRHDDVTVTSSYDDRRISEERSHKSSPEARRYSSDRSSGNRRRRRSEPEATTQDLYDDLVPIDVDAMPDNIGGSLFETRDSGIEYQEAQITNQNYVMSYNVENVPSKESRLVPSRTQRVGAKRGQPAEKPIEIIDAKRPKETEIISTEKEIQNRFSGDPWTGAKPKIS